MKYKGKLYARISNNIYIPLQFDSEVYITSDHIDKMYNVLNKLWDESKIVSDSEYAFITTKTDLLIELEEILNEINNEKEHN